jgi:hypothetical protein
MAELIDMAFTDQALIDPAELLGDGAEFDQRDGAFVHGRYLLGEALNHPEYRAPVVEQPPQSTRRNALPVKRIDGSLVMGHEYLACAVV